MSYYLHEVSNANHETQFGSRDLKPGPQSTSFNQHATTFDFGFTDGLLVRMLVNDAGSTVGTTYSRTKLIIIPVYDE
jgi:hypothetical protein